jgi:hypothetical protein
MTCMAERTGATGEVAAYLAHFDQIAVMTGCLALAGLLVWLAGLLVVLRGSKPAERPSIIRAYATCRPLAFRARTMASLQADDTESASHRSSQGQSTSR